MTRSHSRRAGFTLLEIILVVMIVGGVTTTLAMATSSVLVRASETESKELRIYKTNHALNEIAEAVRLAEQIHQAGDGLLVVSTRYYYDTDDSLEKVRFSLSDTSLLREISHDDGTTWGPRELVAENIASFVTYSFRIDDSFDPAAYDSGLDGIPVGTPTPVDTRVQVERLVKELGVLDPELEESYSAGQLQITSGGVRKSVTVSPPLERNDLQICTSFTPLDVAAGFTAVRYGSDSTGVSVDFSDLGKVIVTSTESSTPLAIEVAALDWSVGVKYSVELRFRDQEAWIRVKSESGTTLLCLSVPAASSLDAAAVHLIAHTPGKPAAWDDLKVGYDVVRLDLGVETGAGTQTLTSKVAPRSW